MGGKGIFILPNNDLLNWFSYFFLFIQTLCMTIFEAIVLAIVEGITEYLPISSTGHLIITNKILGISEDDFSKLFIVCIQFGTILSVVALYWRRFLQSIDFYMKLLIGFLPAAIIGFLASDYIDALLDNVWVVGLMLIIGGIFLLFIDRLFPHAGVNIQKPIYNSTALKIGFFQCLAMIPGVSRSAATIIGGMANGLNRQQAAEFSFFLAVPTMFAASCYDLLKHHDLVTRENLGILLLGNLVGFLVAIVAIRTFIDFLTKYGFQLFGYYRIIVGIIVLLVATMLQ